MTNMEIEMDPQKTVKFAIEGIQEKKGKQIVVLDLNKIENIACKYFVICHGTSKPHVEAIAESIEDFIREKAQDKPINKEGRENAEWILIDYFDIVIHVFQEPVRKFYKLEELWADAEIQNIADLD